MNLETKTQFGTIDEFMKRTLAIGLLTILLGVLFGAGIYFLQYHGIQRQSEAFEKEQIRKTVSGTIAAVEKKSNALYMSEASGTDILVNLTENTEIVDANAKKQLFTDLYPGFTLQIAGLVIKDKTMTADLIKVTNAPSIILESPTGNSKIDYSVNLKGIVKTNAPSLLARIMNETRTTQYGQTLISFAEPAQTTYKKMDTTIRLSRIPRRNTIVLLELTETRGKTDTIIHTTSLEYAPLLNP